MITFNDIYEVKRNPLFSFVNFLEKLNGSIFQHLENTASFVKEIGNDNF